jgi:hypothetical protein
MASKKPTQPKNEQNHTLNWKTLDVARYLRDFPIKEKPKEKELPQSTQNDQGR